MNQLKRWCGAAAFLLTVGVSSTGCDSDGGPYRDHPLGEGWSPVTGDAGPEAGTAGHGADDAGRPDAAVGAACLPVIADALPAREAVLARAGRGEAVHGVLTEDLFGRFVNNCGRCHSGTSALGGLNVKNSTGFAAQIGAEALDRVTSDDPKHFMPPPPTGKPWSSREAGDPVRAFGTELAAWIEAGRPADVFYPEDDAVEGGGEAGPYVLAEEVGMAMTNLGSCVPEPLMVGTDEDDLDAKFAAMKTFADLPKTLRETDLTTLDSAELARHGVIAFAPAYTLWADHAKKIRMIRVPRGKSVRFNPDDQSFDIPKDTRIYKTFLKQVTDRKGNERYRKMETRLILSRPDEGDDYTALFGTYKWNEDETEATLQQEAYSDGEGFADDVSTYVVDEKIEDEVLRSGPRDLAAALRERGATRTYAIPGFDRCVHCHMGAPAKDFILGFTPLQLNRRPEGEGGVIEPAGRDELNQLQRLIDYGIITGMDSSDDIVRLEDSQGSRHPRNEHELDAQGYMLGNCAHCHNPRGFPSRREAVLRDVLDFMPSETGGIFQFPLEKTSPRIKRGLDQQTPIHYITPSLFDLPWKALYPEGHQANYKDEKWIIQPSASFSQALGRKVVIDLLRQYGVEQDDPKMVERVPESVGRPMYAPWRSLIYRNVDGPFSYEDGNAIFPHMPMDTPGYDCRVRQLLGTWMASIPARWKKQKDDESAPDQTRGARGELREAIEMADTDPQPYEEVTIEKDGDVEYAKYSELAGKRVEAFSQSSRIADCPSSNEIDIVAPEVVSGSRTSPASELKEILDPDTGEVFEIYGLPSVPARPHYFKTDLRDLPVWAVRRSDWYSVLVEKGSDPTKQEGDTNSIDALQTLSTMKLTSALKDFALTPVPFGLWEAKAECSAKFDAAQVRTASAIDEAERPSWMAYAGAKETDRVYEIAPGAQVFNTICINCHGPQADGRSALANTIADLTGGISRVANLRDGLFGPIGDPGANRSDSNNFGRAQGEQGLSADDWAARYVAWMGMSGTNATIPLPVVTQIGAAYVLGQARESNIMGVQFEGTAANMLTAVKSACEVLLPISDRTVEFDVAVGRAVEQAGMRRGAAERQATLEGLGLIAKNGDGDLWRSLCEFENPAPIRVVHFNAQTSKFGIWNRLIIDDRDRFVAYYPGLYQRDHYPAQVPVGNGAEIAANLSSDNPAPWCVQAENDEQFATYEESAGRTLPRCPAALLEKDATTERPLHALARRDVDRWSLRGAATAGSSVFLYLNAASKGEITRLPAYNHCEELSAKKD